MGPRAATRILMIFLLGGGSPTCSKKNLGIFSFEMSSECCDRVWSSCETFMFVTLTRASFCSPSVDRRRLIQNLSPRSMCTLSESCDPARKVPYKGMK
ncbi:hypothetical protein B0F90DRAFT_868280 [Multifurca ochricompacta]|uniref:Secreted protein n=1 Tax=Multifurca ochricompacta TaxID=376703 RepID=A0AAD4M1C4_9AGAM|nr:hypothetical protein B0F90DRAFT_868280 [Multifurca ochricompacta]